MVMKVNVGLVLFFVVLSFCDGCASRPSHNSGHSAGLIVALHPDCGCRVKGCTCNSRGTNGVDGPVIDEISMCGLEHSR